MSDELPFEKLGDVAARIVQRHIIKEQLRNEPGLKYDAGKSRIDLVAPEFIEGLGRIQAFGAAKYAERNWEKGMSWGRAFAAVMRHLWAFWRGEELDPETGECHLLHAGCMLMYLYCYWHRKSGTDDRWKGNEVMISATVVHKELTVCGSPEDGGHHDTSGFVDGVTTTPAWRSIELEGPDDKKYYLVDRNFYSDGVVEHLPALLSTVTREDWEKLPIYYRLMYVYDPDDSTYNLPPMFMPHWLGA